MVRWMREHVEFYERLSRAQKLSDKDRPLLRFRLANRGTFEFVKL
jgi:hypothetical protein